MPKNKENLEEKLSLKKENGWSKVTEKETGEILKFAEEYKQFLNNVKTEREAIRFFIDTAEKKGFKNVAKIKKLEPGSKLYLSKNQKVAAFVVMGKKEVTEGVKLVVAHIDSPRLDLKPNPIIEDTDSSTAMLKTHYYGGIKKYQWVSRPLALHGVVVTRKGVVEIKIGETPDEPVFSIPDLEPHLARKVQGEKKLFEGFEGEDLQLLASSIPVKVEEIKSKVKTTLLSYLYNKYGITEDDFQSADLEVVPADKARDVGLDNGLVGAYGQDDRICGYTAFKALADMTVPEFTSIVMVYDKEEIGSAGSSGARSNFLDLVITNLLKLQKGAYTYGDFVETLHRSKALSADVNAALNPLFKQVQDVGNAAKIGYGVVLTKYTGSGGKYNSSEATAEYLNEIRRLFEKNNVIYQMGLLGKVDEGGGGTIAHDFAKYGIDVLDVGPALLSMHSPFEISSKLDLWCTYRAFHTFLK